MRPCEEGGQRAGKHVALAPAAAQRPRLVTLQDGVALADEVRAALAQKCWTRERRRHARRGLRIAQGIARLHTQRGRQASELIDVGREHCLRVALHQLRALHDEANAIRIQHQRQGCLLAFVHHRPRGRQQRRIAPQARAHHHRVEARQPPLDRVCAGGVAVRVGYGVAQVRVHDELGAVALDDRGGAGLAKHVGQIRAHKQGRVGGKVRGAGVFLASAHHRNFASLALVLAGRKWRHQPL
mmetsp:Transcript_29219/g.74959  ORF Transcript_29219/g.74959 Transcript_29219/m.74959 type:complete len:241 (+) Transcript_29219:445-1167(+)